MTQKNETQATTIHQGQHDRPRPALIPNSALFNRKSDVRATPSTPFSGDAAGEIDYKNIELLTQVTSPRGRILPRRITGLSSAQQRKLREAINIARVLALMPFMAK